MPLVAHSSLPTFARLRAEGQEILPPTRARTQDIRELHIGLLNLMPDAALQATERQFLRLLGACNRIAQCYVHPFTFPEIPRTPTAQAHIDAHYTDLPTLQRDGIDALIITGANPAQPDITKESFWQPLQTTVRWATQHTCSILCSCLATHAIVHHLWGIHRYPLPRKRWGIYSTRLTPLKTASPHPLITNINTRFDAPHSHLYEVSTAQFQAAGLLVLAHSPQADLHLATSPDGIRFVFFQGHPEYDAISLLKEYRREVTRFTEGTRPDYPPFPEHYFPPKTRRLLTTHRTQTEAAITTNVSPPPFPETEALRGVDNTWTDTGKALFNNWLGIIYQLAHPTRGHGFMPGIDPQNPLNLPPPSTPPPKKRDQSTPP